LDRLKDDVIAAYDLDAKGRLVDNSELVNRNDGVKDAVLGVGTATVGGIEVGNTGGRRGLPTSVIEQLIESGQAYAAPGEQSKEEGRVELPEGPAHGTSLL
jgi:hypothetical protein